jgi:hypothetical protein
MNAGHHNITKKDELLAFFTSASPVLVNRPDPEPVAQEKPLLQWLVKLHTPAARQSPLLFRSI